MNPSLAVQVPDDAAMRALGGALAAARKSGLRVHLRGELGAGKTTLVRGFLQAAGHAGAVRSPTYTLVEPYDLATGPVFHLDLYRLSVAEELEYLGLRDLERPDAVLLVEWPERGTGVLPRADLEVTLDYAGTGRRVTFEPGSEVGAALLARLKLPPAVKPAPR